MLQQKHGTTLPVHAAATSSALWCSTAVWCSTVPKQAAGVQYRRRRSPHKAAGHCARDVVRVRHVCNALH
jgi:hypothetical protein